MSTELVINSTQDGCRIALLKDRGLVEYHRDEGGNNFKVGDIYLGTVRKVVQGLNAAFIDIGYEKDAFLHYLDLGPKFSSLKSFTRLVQTRKNATSRLNRFKIEPDIDKHGKITEVLSKISRFLFKWSKSRSRPRVLVYPVSCLLQAGTWY